MDQLTLLIGLLFGTVVAVGLGDRLRLPYPVLMLVFAAALAFIPGFPEVSIDPDLILPLFLPPLLFATAQKSSWSVFRVRWKTILLLAVALVALTTAVVAGAAWLLIPSMGLPAAVALGAMVAPPDPVAVESVAGKVHMPRRLLTVLQSEGLFNDAAAIVIFQAAVGAVVSGNDLGIGLVPEFLLGAAGAIIIGLLMGRLTSLITRVITETVARSAVTLVVPFTAYIVADEVHASGVIAVVVTALEIKRHARPEDAAERVIHGSFWDVVELLVTGVAFGLVGLEMRQVIKIEGARIFDYVPLAVVVCLLVFAVRFLWFALLSALSTRNDDDLPPTSAKDVLILSWCGMRGLATLALALALPTLLDNHNEFPARSEIVVVACSVLVATLVLPGLTLPRMMRVLKASDDGSEEREAARLLALRAQSAAMSALRHNDKIRSLPKDKLRIVKERMARLHAELVDIDPDSDSLDAHRKRVHELLVEAQTIALDAARQEVVAARNEPETDPMVADRVLRQLDLRTMSLPPDE